MKLENIDSGQEFDWGSATEDYARYRDIYPASFFRKLKYFGIATKDQKVLDIGSGTGVLPRAMYSEGARFYATDISHNQIKYGRELAEGQGMNIHWRQCPAEATGFPDNFFDSITAMACWHYFDPVVMGPEAHRMLKPGGRLAIAHLIWLSDESVIAEMSEKLVSSFNPKWSGIGIKRTALKIPDWLGDHFIVETLHTYDESLPFTRETWNGRIKACRGIGASLDSAQIRAFQNQHMKRLMEIAPEQFAIPHQMIIEIYKVTKKIAD